MDTNSKLPSAQQERRDKMLQQAEGGTVDSTQATVHTLPGIQHVESSVPATGTTETVKKPEEKPQVETQTVTTVETQKPVSDELEQIKRELRLRELELAEARAQNLSLTTSAEPSKARGEGFSGSSVVLESGPLQIESDDEAPTEDEIERFGEAESYVTKLANRAAVAQANKALEHINARLLALESGVNKASSTAKQASEESFTDKVKSKVGNFNTVITHPKWAVDFRDEPMPLAGMTYGQALAKAHNERRLDDVVGIFKAFETKYGVTGSAVTESDTGTGYGAIAPVDAQVTREAGSTTKLPFSERKQASEDFLKGRITQETLTEIVNKYRAAEKAGNIDYDN